MRRPGKYYFRRARQDRECIQFRVQRRITGVRLDRYLAERFEGYSRTFFRDLVRRGKVLVDRLPARPSHKVAPDEVVTLFLPRSSVREPYPLPLEVIFQDRFVVAVNKPPGLVVHPARGHVRDTLLNALFHRFRREMEEDPAFHVGTVHRLDIDTSGVILYALDGRVHWQLQRQFEGREVRKTYLCIVHGAPEWDATDVEAALGVDPENRKKFAVDGWDSRPAHTGFEVLAGGSLVTLVRAYLHTGRSHQIRVHAAHAGHPIVGDELYGGRRELGTGEFLIGRQALHSEMLEFHHPGLDKRMRIRAGLPGDMRELLERRISPVTLEALHLDNAYEALD